MSNAVSTPDFAPQNQAEFGELSARLRKAINPQGAVEGELFAAYAWSTFQAERCRGYESFSAGQLEELTEEDDEAARSFAILGEVQANRIAATEVQVLLQETGVTQTIAPAVPLCKLGPG